MDRETETADHIHAQERLQLQSQAEDYEKLITEWKVKCFDEQYERYGQHQDLKGSSFLNLRLPSPLIRERLGKLLASSQSDKGGLDHLVANLQVRGRPMSLFLPRKFPRSHSPLQTFYMCEC